LLEATDVAPPQPAPATPLIARALIPHSLWNAQCAASGILAKEKPASSATLNKTLYFYTAFIGPGKNSNGYFDLLFTHTDHHFTAVGGGCYFAKGLLNLVKLKLLWINPDF